MKQQLTDLAANGVLGRFVGMLTDSRSFLSYTRHEYFRRILCDVIGNWVESGQYPNDKKMLTKLVEDICYNNTNNFFRFGK
jgi:glucuronate isomerase